MPYWNYRTNKSIELKYKYTSDTNTQRLCYIRSITFSMNLNIPGRKSCYQLALYFNQAGFQFRTQDMFTFTFDTVFNEYSVCLFSAAPDHTINNLKDPISELPKLYYPNNTMFNDLILHQCSKSALPNAGNTRYNFITTSPFRTLRYVNSPCDGLYTRCLNNTPALKPTPKITSPVPTITTSTECKAILFLERCKAPYRYVYPTYAITTCQIGYCQAGLMWVNIQTLPQRIGNFYTNLYCCPVGTKFDGTTFECIRTRFRINARYENKDCKEQEENGFCQSQIKLDIKEGLVTDENITSTCDEECSYYQTDIYLTPTDITNCNISKED